MSSHEERLKELAGELRSQKDAADRAAQEQSAHEQSERRESATVAASEASSWIARLREFVAATGMRVPYNVSQDLGGEAGFDITVGTARLRVVYDAQGWRATTVSPRELLYNTSLSVTLSGRLANLSAARDDVLERMVAQGLRDLVDERVQPGPDGYRR